jgi:hypothetical protein
MEDSLIDAVYNEAIVPQLQTASIAGLEYVFTPDWFDKALCGRPAAKSWDLETFAYQLFLKKRANIVDRFDMPVEFYSGRTATGAQHFELYCSASRLALECNTIILLFITIVCVIAVLLLMFIVNSLSS